MAETEVESILREIRERVLSEQRAGEAASTRATGANGAGESANIQQVMRRENSEIPAEEHLALINSYLTTTARAWDRLPPLVSNRSGLVARIELWLKRNLKRATRWYAWEQINFNAATHHALRDMLPLLSAHEQELKTLRTQIEVDVQHRRTELERFLNEIEPLRLAMETQKIQSDSRLAEIVSDLRERIQHSLDEQRVSFKQVALETSEAAVLEDRARRKTDALLKELQRRVERLEKA
jgi:hypothetical protein